MKTWEKDDGRYCGLLYYRCQTKKMCEVFYDLGVIRDCKNFEFFWEEMLGNVCSSALGHDRHSFVMQQVGNVTGEF